MTLLLLALTLALPARAERLNVIVFTMDAVSSSHVSAYGYRRPTTPNLDALAREGIRFANAYSPSSWTLPSIASLWTARYPEFHDATLSTNRLSPALPTLVRELRSAGYSTGAFLAGLPADPSLGMAREFEHRFEESRSSGAAIVDAALGWMPSKRPFFLWAHTFETHLPYSCPEVFRERYGRGYQGPVHHESIDRDVERQGQFNLHFNEEVLEERRERELTELVAALKRIPKDLRHFTDHYDGCLSYSDAQLGRLLAGLKARGLYESTLIVVTSDHGERLADGKGGRLRLGHGGEPDEDVVRVPFVIRHPRRWTGRVIRHPVTTVDLAPTLLSALGLPALRGAQGLDLGAWLDGTEKPPRDLVYASDLRAHVWLRAVRKGDWKLLRGASGWSLFNLAEDPHETRDRQAEQPAVFLDLAKGFLDTMADARASLTRAGEPVIPEY